MFKRFVSTLTRLLGVFRLDRDDGPLFIGRSAPLDQVERLQREGTTLRVLMEFGRAGW
jgi:hypothetical protein